MFKNLTDSNKMTDIFNDKNFDKPKILNLIKNASTFEDIFSIIEKNFNKLIAIIALRYSNEYDFLNTNWAKTCQKISKDYNKQVTKKAILLLNGLKHDNEHTLVSTLAEILTIFGFSVRSIQHMKQCPECREIFPTFKYYEVLKEYNKNIPKKYSENCINCLKKEK